MLFLIDGNFLLYRSYYAIRGLTNSQGTATNAAYGFLAGIRKLIEQEGPEYLGVVFDSKGPTFRHSMYQDYKATRKPMPEDLVPQVPIVKDLLKALRIPVFEQPGYEGDDILGSLARKPMPRNVHAVLMSQDKDLYQLVNSSTSIFNPMKDQYLGEKAVKDIFGVRPDQVVGVLALWGDSSDNVPGVAGIGEKTAKALINQYDSLDNLLENLSHLKNPRVRTRIQENLDSLDLSRRLVTIETGLELELNLEALAVTDPDYDALLPLLQELEFTSLLSDYVGRAHRFQTSYSTLLQEKDLKKLVADIQKAKAVSLDTETDCPAPTRARLVGMSFAREPGKAAYLPLAHDYAGAPDQIPKDKALKLLEPILTDPGIKKIGQNIKYDLIVLQREGLTLRGIDRDTMVLSYLNEPNWGRHNLGRLALTYLQVKAMDYHDVVGKGKDEVTMNTVDIARVTPYACQDADLALQLAEVLAPKVREKGQDRLYEEIERPLIPVLAQMEMWGIKIDPHVLEGLSAELKERMEAKDFCQQRRGIQPQLPAAARTHPVRKAEAPGHPEDEKDSRLLHQPESTPGAGRWLSHRTACPGIPAAGQTEVHLCRCPAPAHPPRDEKNSYLLQPDSGRHRPPLLQRSQPAEHPHTRSMGPALSSGLCPGTGPPVSVRRLFADRTACSGPPVGRPGLDRYVHP